MTTNERIQSYLDAIPPAIEGQGGDTHLFYVACVLYNGFALSETETLRWLEIFNQKCLPPWTGNDKEKTFAHKVASCVKTPHQKPRGHLLGPGISQIEPEPIRRPKRSETPISTGKLVSTATTPNSHIMHSVVNNNSSSRVGLKLPLYPYQTTATTAKSEKSGTENQWKVPDPPPGLNWAERQKFYMDDLRDAIGDEWITAPSGRPAMGRPDPVPRHGPRK